MCGVLAVCGPRGSWGHTYLWVCIGGPLSFVAQRDAVAVATGTVASSNDAGAIIQRLKD